MGQFSNDQNTRFVRSSNYYATAKRFLFRSCIRILSAIEEISGDKIDSTGEPSLAGTVARAARTGTSPVDIGALVSDGDEGGSDVSGDGGGKDQDGFERLYGYFAWMFEARTK